MSNRTPWDDIENGALVALYFRMLDGSTRTGSKLNKAALVRIAQDANADDRQRVTMTGDFAGKLAARSRPSIEFKLMNASAAHAALAPGAETMDGHGYRAMPNYQAALAVAMSAALDRRNPLATGTGHFND